MKMTLAKKIIGPFALLGVLVVAMIVVMFVMDSRREATASEERALLGTMTGLHKVSDYVKSGILTRKESFAIDTAAAALSVDTDLGNLGDSGQTLRQQFQDFFAAVVAINSIYLENRTTEGEKRLDQLRQQEMTIEQAVKTRIDEVASERNHLATFARSFQATVFVVLMAALVFITLLVTRNVVRPVTEMRDLIRDIAQGDGDLTARLKKNSNDEIGEIADAFNTMIAKLQDIMRFVIATSNDVAHSADQLASAMVQATRATERQSESASTTAAAVEQVSVSITQVADHAREAEAISIQADTLANTGKQTADVSANQVAATSEAVGNSRKRAERALRADPFDCECHS